MIEIIYNKEKEIAAGNEEFFCVPKNIRQIGEVSKSVKIYMEDYVYTYLTEDWKTEEKKAGIAVLLGKYNWKNKVSYIFIKSAVFAQAEEIAMDKDALTDEVWGKIYEEMKQYFPGQEVVGWCLSLPDGNLRIDPHITRTHLKHFGGNDKVLLYMDSYERESAFFLYKNDRMEKVSGYYIFYEKNDQMQEYMLAKKPEQCGDYSGKAQDRAVRDFREKVAKKMSGSSAKEIELSWGHVACAGIVIAALAIGTVWVQKQQEGQKAEVSSEEAAYIIEENDGMTLLTPVAEEEKDVYGDGGAESGRPLTETESGSPAAQDGSESPAAQDGSESPAAQDGTGDQTVQDRNESQPAQGGTGSQSVQGGTGSQSVQGGTGSQTAQDGTGSQSVQGGTGSQTAQDGTGSQSVQGGSSSQATQDRTETQPSSGLFVYTKYTVRPGDTLSQISLRYYGDFSKITEICKINNLLAEDIIYPGQTILLP